MNENNEYKRLKKELEKIRSDYGRATRILRNIEVFGVEEFAIKFKEWKEKLLNDESGVDVVWKWINEYEEKIESSKNTSQELVNTIKNNLEEVNENIGTMQTAYEKFLTLHGKIESSDTNIQNLSDNAKQLKNDIENLKTQSQETLESIKKLFKDANTQILNMQGAYDSFLEIKGKIEDEENGLKAIFDFVKNLKEKSQLLYKDIQKFRDESKSLLENIKKNKEDSEILKGDIETLFDTSKTTTDEKIEEIEKITALITDTGFSNSFKERKEEIQKGTPTWKWLFFGSLGLLGVAVIFLQTPWSGINANNIYEAFFYRIILTSPLWALSVFSAIQYSKERQLEEDYAFRAASATTIRSHIEFLESKFTNPDDKKVILKFAQETFSKIYKEPYKNESDSKNIELEKKVKELSKKDSDEISIEKVLKSSKELRSLFEDESLLKEVIAFFTNLSKK